MLQIWQNVGNFQFFRTFAIGHPGPHPRGEQVVPARPAGGYDQHTSGVGWVKIVNAKVLN